MTDPVQVEEIFKAALDHPTSERRAYVLEACGADDDLRDEVEALLDADGAADGFLESPLRSLALERRSQMQRSFGPYEIVAELGRGGMGVVFEARQERPARSVALKVVRVGLGGRGAVERFLHEIEVLGRLRHPGIAQIYAADVHEGVPYYAMELIADAMPITTYCEAAGLSNQARMELVALACDAVQHGHDRGVIHRDIKPSNVVVDGDGVPKVIDFGVARASDGGGREAYTATGHIVGTVRYMSPEQRTVDGDVDVRSDVYSLGLVLYEVLVGRYPFELRGSTPLALVKELESVDVALPSGVVPQLRGDPETILLRALARDPDRRYASARALAEDLRRCIRGEPIEARRDELSYLLRKALARHKLPVVASLAAAALLVGGGLLWVRTLEAERTARAIDRAEAAELRAEQADELRKSSYVLRIALASKAYSERNLGRMRMLLAQCPEPLRGWEWRRLSWLSDRSAAKVSAHAGTIEVVAFDSTGERLASAGADGAVHLWRLGADGSLTRTGTLRSGGKHLFALAWTPDGNSIATGGETPAVDVVDATTGALEHSFSVPEYVRGLAVSPDGTRLAAAGDDDVFRVWNLESKLPVATLEAGDQAMAVAFAGNGDLLTGSADERLRRWDLESGRPRWDIHVVEDAVETLALSPDGRRIALGGWDPKIVVVDAETGETQARLSGHTDGVREVQWSPSGDAVISAGWDDVVRVWDVASESQTLALRGHESNVEALAVAPDGRHIVSGADDRKLRVWDLERGQDHRVLPGQGAKVHALAFSPDGTRIVTGGGPHHEDAAEAGSLRVWDVASGQTLRAVPDLEQGIMAVAIDPRGQLVAAGGRSGRIRVEVLESGTKPRVLPGHDGIVTAVAWRDESLLSTGRDGVLVQWDVEALAAEHRLRLPSVPMSVAIVDDAVIIGLADGTLRLWRDGDVTTELGKPAEDEIRALAPIGTDRVVVAAADGTLAVVDARTGAVAWSVDTYDGGLSSVAVNASGDRIAVGDTEFNVRLFDAARGDELMLVGRHDSFVSGVAFSPDGERLASAGFDRVVRLWETSD